MDKRTLRAVAVVAASVVIPSLAPGQTTMLPSITEALASPTPTVPVTEYQLEQYLMKRIPGLPSPSSAQQWTSEESHLRQHLLNDVIFHGWPSEWVHSPLHFEEAGIIETGHGYRIRKLRYEVLPGFFSTALLYEPEKLSRRAPAILNLIGHEPEGTAVEYEQKRCINFAKRGIIALNLGWMEFGELSQPENSHDNAAALDLIGVNAIGLFYLAMRRGLDYLAASPEVDTSRIGATGLSGGGWQTVVLSALDPRISVAVAVAGIGSKESNLTNPKDTFEIEEDSPDIMQGFDYPTFIAMRAPHPTLLVHNAVDSCCFRAPLVEPYVYEAVKPFYEMYSAADNLAWHENFDPGVHNYQRDNRTEAYRFFDEQFHIQASPEEIFSDSEIHTASELAVSLPKDNQTVLGIARGLSAHIKRIPIPGGDVERGAWARSQRAQLNSTVRYHPVSVSQALRTANSEGMDFQTLTYRFDFSNGLSAMGMWFKQDASPASEPFTVVLDDGGFKHASRAVYDSLSAGHEVIALDPLFTGFSKPDMDDPSDWIVLVDSSGDRSLGLEVAQLLSVIHWLHSTHPASQITVKTNGIRMQMVALVAAALEPAAFATIDGRGGMTSLAYLLDKPVPLRSASDLFCLDLYKDFDVDDLIAMAAPVKVTQSDPVDSKSATRARVNADGVRAFTGGHEWVGPSDRTE